MSECSEFAAGIREALDHLIDEYNRDIWHMEECQELRMDLVESCLAAATGGTILTLSGGVILILVGGVVVGVVTGGAATAGTFSALGGGAGGANLLYANYEECMEELPSDCGEEVFEEMYDRIETLEIEYSIAWDAYCSCLYSWMRD